MKHFIRNHILKSFFQIQLTSIEKGIAEEAIIFKYSPSIQRSILHGFLASPAILLLDSEVIISVLIPITLVAGTAWFSISLASVKKKFESFGIELTKDVFESFVTSLILLVIISTVSLFSPFLTNIIALGQSYSPIIFISALLGIYVIFQNIYKIFLGSLKYDVNDSMLAGQSEAAEKFFHKSLSFLQITAKTLRDGKSLQVANYYIGLFFFEIFTYIDELKIYSSEEIGEQIDKANTLINNPGMTQIAADTIAIELIRYFLIRVIQENDANTNKSIQAIEGEVKNITKKNSGENQEMIDTRMSIIFQEIGEMIDNSGESLFVKN